MPQKNCSEILRCMTMCMAWVLFGHKYVHWLGIHKSVGEILTTLFEYFVAGLESDVAKVGKSMF